MSCMIERGNPLFAVTRATSATDLVYATHQTHDNWVAYFRIWSRRSLHRFCGRAQTWRETNPTCKIHEGYCASHKNSRPKSFAPTLQNLRIGLRRRQSGKSKVPAKQRGSWPKVYLNSRSKKEQHSSHFRKNRCLTASTLKPEEREFVVHSGASMHMISKKDLSDTEMDTLTKSCSPTNVITANGDVQTHEEATVYVKELDIFLTMIVLENTPAVLSLGKLCDKKAKLINGSMVKNHISLKT